MSGLCGWIGHSGPPDKMRAWIGAMAAPLTREDQSTAALKVGRGSAVGATGLGGTAAVAAADGLLAAIMGRPAWSDPEVAAIAERDGDAAALLDAYRRKGAPGLLPGLKGAFSLALLDENAGQAILAVDRVASLPLVYGWADGTLLFASRGESLWGHPRGAASIDPQSVYNYLYHGAVPAPRTIRRGQSRLLPGEFVRLAGGRIGTAKYSVVEYRDHDAAPFERLASEFRDLLRQCVGRDAQGASVGTFLSGGTDSSTVTGVLGEVSGAPARAYSIGFDAPGYDEMGYARIAAKRFHAEHHEHYVTPEEVVEAIPRVARIYSDPFGNESAVAAYYCARMAREQGVERLLAGDGGDELFAGNARYAKPRVFSFYTGLPGPMRRWLIEPLLFAVPGGEKIWPVRKLRSYVRQANIPMPARMEVYNYLERFGPARIFRPEFLEQVDEGKAAFAPDGERGPLLAQLWPDAQQEPRARRTPRSSPTVLL